MEYLSRIRQGVMIILACILITVILTVGVLIATASMAIAQQGPIPRGVEFLIGMFSFLVSIVSIYGYFLFSTPDPGVDPNNKGDRPRRVLRAAIITQAVLSPISSFAEFLLPVVAPGMTGGAFSAAAIATIGFMVVSLIAWAAAFFASMRYMRWLAPRIPDGKMFDRARKYEWVLPLWYIPGSCIAIGPIVALVLYYNFFNDLRKHLDRIIAQLRVSAASPL
jgi:hypothetical protein